MAKDIGLFSELLVCCCYFKHLHAKPARIHHEETLVRVGNHLGKVHGARSFSVHFYPSTRYLEDYRFEGPEYRSACRYFLIFQMSLKILNTGVPTPHLIQWDVSLLLQPYVYYKFIVSVTQTGAMNT